MAVVLRGNRIIANTPIVSNLLVELAAAGCRQVVEALVRPLLEEVSLRHPLGNLLPAAGAGNDQDQRDEEEKSGAHPASQIPPPLRTVK